MNELPEINEHTEMYLQSCVEEIDEKFCQYIHAKIHEFHPSINTKEGAIYLYAEMTRKIFSTTVKFFQIAANLSKKDAKDFLTDICHGKFDN